MLHMERKDYKLEIVGALIGNSFHARELARRFGINHMMLNRKFGELVLENVVDYRMEGRNKVYFMKDSVEARAYIFMAESYKLVRLLRMYPSLRRIVDSIVKDKRLGFVVLFGSYAKGLAKRSSDIDIFVETGNRNLKRELEKLNFSLNVKIGKFDGKSLLGREILRNHIVLKGVERLYG